MLIVGTGGLARDVITSWEVDKANMGKQLYLFDNFNTEQHLLYNKYPVYHTFDQLKEHFETVDRRFFVCVGNPLRRMRITEQVEKLGGELVPFVSCAASIVSPYMPLGPGVVIEPGVVVSKDVVLKKGVFVNAGTIIGHDAVVEKYVSFGPGVRILGRVEVGEYSYIGCNAVIMPGVKIGKKVRIGVAKVIDEDIPDNSKIM